MIKPIYDIGPDAYIAHKIMVDKINEIIDHLNAEKVHCTEDPLDCPALKKFTDAEKGERCPYMECKQCISYCQWKEENEFYRKAIAKIQQVDGDTIDEFKERIDIEINETKRVSEMFKKATIEATEYRELIKEIIINADHKNKERGRRMTANRFMWIYFVPVFLLGLFFGICIGKL